MKDNLQLLTIYNAREYDVKEKTQGKKIILEQLNGKTVHYLTD
jgi:hypothetical protein